MDTETSVIEFHGSDLVAITITADKKVFPVINKEMMDLVTDVIRQYIELKQSEREFDA